MTTNLWLVIGFISRPSDLRLKELLRTCLPLGEPFFDVAQAPSDSALANLNARREFPLAFKPVYLAAAHANELAQFGLAYELQTFFVCHFASPVMSTRLPDRRTNWPSGDGLRAR